MFLLFVCVALWGQQSTEKQQMRIQEGHFLKIALNLDLALPDDGECPALLISCGIIDFGAFCVELWSFFVSKRISVHRSQCHIFRFESRLVGNIIRIAIIIYNPIYNYNL